MTDSHRALREQLGAYALGQLSGEPWRVVNAHLNECEQCSAALAEIAPVVGLLDGAAGWVDLDGLAEPAGGASSVGPAAVPPGAPPLSPALLAEVRAATEDETGQLAHRRSARLRRSAVAAAAAAAVLASGGVGLVIGTSISGDATPAGEPVPVQAAAQQVRASAQLVAHTWGMEVKLTGTGFAAGQAYRVMVTDDAGRTAGAGEFIGTGEAEMRCNLNSSVLRADASAFQVTDMSGQLVLTGSL